MAAERGRYGVTLAEVLVVIAIIGALAGVFVPVGLQIRRYAVRVSCANNLSQLGVCVLMYAEEWNGRLPAEGAFGITNPAKSPAWFDRLPSYLDDAKVGMHSIFQCSGFRWSGSATFANAIPKSLKMNSYLDSAGRPRHYRCGSVRGSAEANVVLFVDAVAGDTGMGQWGHCVSSAVTDERHPGAVNVLCLDGRTLTVVSTPKDGRWSRAITWLPDGWDGGP